MRFRKRFKQAFREVDPLIPIMNLVCMLIPLLIFGAVFVRYKTVSITAPKNNIDILQEKTDALNLTVFITQEGFSFRVNPSHRQPWMGQSKATRPGPDIPMTDNGYDFSTLTLRLREIKQNFDRETHIVLGAEENISFDTIIKTMDASRGKDSELFPEVTLTREVG